MRFAVVMLPIVLAVAGGEIFPASAELAGGGARAICATNDFACRVWRTEEGLPQNSVTAIWQTRDGYLWLGTPGGLVRFDGIRFMVFGVADGLPGLHVRTLFEDRQGALWIGTASGLGRYWEGRFTNITTREGLAGDAINSITEDRDGTLWVGTSTGLSRGRGGRFETVGADRGLTESYMRASVVDHQGTLWVTALKVGLMRWDGRAFVAVATLPEGQQARPDCLTLDGLGRIWTGGRGWVLCLEQDSIKAYGSAEGLPNARITCITVARDGTVWAGSIDRGLYYLRDGRFASVRWPEELPDRSVQAVREDREGNLWVGTRSGGLSRLKPSQVVTLQMKDQETDIAPLSLAEYPDGVFWIGTIGRGLYRLADNQPEEISEGRSQLYVGVIAATRDGSIWWSDGVRLRQWKDGGEVIAFGEESWLRDDVVQCLLEDPQEGLWVGSHRGRLMLWRSGQFTPVATGLAAAALTAMAQQRDGTLWVGSYGAGLARLKDGQRTRYDRAQGLRSSIIRSLLLDGEETLWIGTEGGGLSRFKAGRITSFGAAQGVADDTIVQMLEDDSGHLWLGTYRGIYRIARRDLEELAAGTVSRVDARVFDRSEGMQSARCKGGFGTCLKTRGRGLWFCTDRDITIIDPAKEPRPAPPPRVLLEEIRINDRIEHAEALPREPDGGERSPTRRLRIQRGKCQFEVNYTGLSFTAPERVRFRYRLEGLDADWIEAGTRRVANYGYLPPDDYRFRVTAHNGDGVWSQNEASVALVVVRFFWQTWWFRLALAAGFTLGVIAVVRYVSFRRLQRQLRLAEQQAALHRERARIAKDIHDDLGANLTQIALLGELAQRDQAQQETATRRLDTISTTARQTIKALDEIVWAVNPRNDTLSHLIEYTGQFALDYLRLANIRCRLDFPESIPVREFSADRRHNLFLAAKEALTNVVKHSHATEVWFRVSVTVAALEMAVEDNGQGFDLAARAAAGEGLRNLRQRLAGVGGECQIESRPGAGTCVLLRLPWRHN